MSEQLDRIEAKLDEIDSIVNSEAGIRTVIILVLLGFVGSSWATYLSQASRKNALVVLVLMTVVALIFVAVLRNNRNV